MVAVVTHFIRSPARASHSLLVQEGPGEYSGPSGALIPFEVGQDSVVMWGAIPLVCGAGIERERNRAPHARNRAPREP